MTLDPKQLCKHAGYRSIEQLAAKVWELWDEPEPGAKPQPRSLATRIGALARPDGAGWWTKRPLATAALCEALDIAGEELGIGGLAVPDGRWVFRECPQLRPLDLSRERPCHIANWRGREDFFSWPERSSGLGPMRATSSRGHPKLMFHPVGDEPAQFWGRVPRGWGRVLLAASFAAADSSTHVEVDTLQEGTDHPDVRGPGRVIFSVLRPDPDTDFDAFSRLRQRGDGFVVLASHQPPSRRPGNNVFWPWDTPRVQRHEASDRRELWTGVLTPSPGWRTKLLHWAMHRSTEPFDPDALAKWLDDADPEHEAVRSPEDLLGVLSLILERGRGRVTRKSFDANAREMAKLVVARATVGLDDAWLRDEGAELVCELAAERARCSTVPLDGPLSAAEWACLVPKTRLPGEPDDNEPVTRDALARSAVRRLSAVGLLRQRSNGLELGPDWVTRAIGRQAITKSVEQDGPQTWGELAAQPDRRALIDASTRTLSVSTVERQLTGALEAPSSLGRAAALESLVVAVSRSDAQIPEEVAQRVILELIRGSVAEPEGWPPRPMTRAGTDNPHERVDALLAGWAWSRMFPCPAPVLPIFSLELGDPWSAEALQLCFPSWWPPEAAALSKLLDQWFQTPSNGTASRGDHFADFRALSYGPRAERLMDEASEFVGDLTGPWPDTPAPWLVAARLLSGESFEWLSVTALKSLTSHEGVVDWVSRTLPNSGGRELSRAIMRVALTVSGGFDEMPDRLSRAVQAQLEADDVRALINDHGYPWCLRWLSWTKVEPRLRLVIAATALAHPRDAGPFWAWLLEAHGWLGSDDVETLEFLARSRHPQLGMVGAELWRIRPTLAAELAWAELGERCKIGLVCRAATVDGLRALLPTIREVLVDQPPMWLAPLLRVHVAAGGELGEVAFTAAS